MASLRLVVVTVACALASTLASGCSHTVAVRAPVLVPAQVPVRAFPSIWISGGMLPDELYLQDRLATHLAENGQHEVRRVELADLEPARKAGQIPAATVVVLVELESRADTRNEWDTVPMSVCGYYGCYTQFQSYPMEVPELRGTATMTVYEGPTARVLQRARFHGAAYELEEREAEEQLVEQLARDLELAVDVLRVRDKVELYEVDVPGVRDAIGQIRRGHWDEGRALLERAKDQLSGQSKKTQARVWFNLGLARWFAPGPQGLSEKAYDDARRALLQAEKLAHHPVYQRMLQRLEKARKDFALIEEQRKAAATNFALAAQEQAEPQVDAQTASPGEEPPGTDAPTATPPGSSEAPVGAPAEPSPSAPAAPPASEWPKPPRAASPAVPTPPPPPTP